MQRWIPAAIGLLFWSCGSHKPITVSLDQQKVNLGGVVNLRVENAPEGSSVRVRINNSPFIPVDAHNPSLAITADNGFDVGTCDVFVVLTDRKGYEIPLASHDPLHLEVSLAHVQIEPETGEAPASGGGGRIMVKAGADYHWAATNLPAWIQFTPAAQGSGTAILEYTVSPNATPQPRSAKIGIGDAILTITQLAPFPSGSPAPVSDASAKAGPATARVAFDKSTVRPDEDVQISIEQVPAGWTGELLVNSVKRFPIDSKTYKLAASTDNGFRESGPTDLYVLLLDANHKQIPLPNNGFYRITVQPTAVRLDPLKENAGPQQESARLKVNVSAGYQWSVGTVPDWIRIDSGRTGFGSGTVAYTVLENTTNEPRSASLTVGDALHQVTQARSLTIRVPYHDVFHYTAAPLPGYVPETDTTPMPNRWRWDEQTAQHSEVALSQEGPPGSASMIVQRPDKDQRDWATQVYLRNLNLQPGVRYRVTARMKAENPGAVTFGFGQSDAPYKECGPSRTFQITNVWTQYETELSESGDACNALNNRLSVRAGQIRGKLWVADFSIVRAP